MATPREPSPTGATLSLRGWAQEAEAAATIAKALAPTAFIPDHLRVWRNPNDPPAKRQLDLDSTVAQVAAVLLAGQELELPPMASLRAFVIIRGQVAMYAIAARALLLHRGHEIVVVETTAQRAVVRGRRAGSPHWQEARWDIPRAQTAGLFPGHVDGRWRKDPKAMMVARATAEVSRWVAADAMLALPPMAEEVDDEGTELPPAPEAIAAAPEANGQAADTTTTVKRRAPRTRAALPAGPPPAPDSPVPPPPDVPAPVPEDEAPPGPRPSQAQIGKLHAGLRDLQVAGREEGLALVSAWAGRRDRDGHPVTLTSTAQLTAAEMGIVLERIDMLRGIGAADDPEPPPPDDALEQDPP
jgi:hypothetical protein